MLYMLLLCAAFFAWEPSQPFLTEIPIVMTGVGNVLAPLLPITPSFARVMKKGCRSYSEMSGVSSIILPLAARVIETQNSTFWPQICFVN